MERPRLLISSLGTLAYGEALERQLAAVEARRAGGPDRLLLLEHPPVVTLGRSAKPENLLTPPDRLAKEAGARKMRSGLVGLSVRGTT